MELRDALSQIAEIRQQMARSHTFRGYRSATTAFSGVVAIFTALLQQFLLPRPGLAPIEFVLIWVAAAVVSLIIVGAEMIIRTRHAAGDAVQRELTHLAVEQFMPSIIAGALLTTAICIYRPNHIDLLPGLWMILFSLGVFASRRLLPRGVFAVAGFYLVSGIATLVLSPAGSYEALFMGGVFSIGQFALAAILYFRLERGHE